MVTKEQAIIAPHGATFEHESLKNKDGSPIRCRKTGKCKTWKTRPKEFRLPVKHGMYHSFHITHVNAHEWSLAYKVHPNT